MSGIVVGTVVLWHLGLFHQLIENDVSRLSSLIILIFLVASAHACFNLVRYSNEIEAIKERDAVFSVASLKDRKKLISAGPELPTWLQRQIATLTQIYSESERPEKIEHRKLLDTLDARIKAPVRLGWLLADLLIKLGLLGTVIGFILMLGAISGAENLDVSNIQLLLGEMGAGMRVALYTTLCGLTAGTLLGFQYFIVEQCADVLVGMITEFIEIKALRHADFVTES